MRHASTAFRPVLGVTMRLASHPGTGDVRDALSHDWGRFLAAAGLAWLPLPNRGEETLALARELSLGGFIFSGGGDAGREPARDHTEALLFAHARAHGLPVLGVCRGLQALQLLLGGELVPVPGHVAVRHSLEVASGTGGTGLAAMQGRKVNSYHNFGIRRAAPGLTPWAHSVEADGSRHVEAVSGAALLGCMWHPEREALPRMADVTLVREFFLKHTD